MRKQVGHIMLRRDIVAARLCRRLSCMHLEAQAELTGGQLSEGCIMHARSSHHASARCATQAPLARRLNQRTALVFDCHRAVAALGPWSGGPPQHTRSLALRRRAGNVTHMEIRPYRRVDERIAAATQSSFLALIIGRDGDQTIPHRLGHHAYGHFWRRLRRGGRSHGVPGTATSLVGTCLEAHRVHRCMSARHRRVEYTGRGS